MAATLFHLLLFFLSCTTTIMAGSKIRHGGVFSFDLIHRDSPLISPLYRPSSKTVSQAEQLAQRSVSRLYHLASSPPSATGFRSPVAADPGDYLMRLVIGTPGREFWAAVSTGSTLVWTRCLPCTSCFPEPAAPIFNPRLSSTYHAVDCNSSLCSRHYEVACDPDRRCHYSYANTKGTISSETFTFTIPGSPRNVVIPAIIFGCDHEGGLENSSVDGVVGLGRGSLSLVSQLGSHVGNKFSYCLVPRDKKNSTGRIEFGEAISGAGNLRRTPMKTETYDPEGYYVTLIDLSVGNKRLNLNRQDGSGDRSGSVSMVIDSGTPLTALSADAYYNLTSAINEIVKLPPGERNYGFDLCYAVNDARDLRGFPEVTLHFEGGADWILPPSTAFYPAAVDVVCLAMLPSFYGISVLGNIAQQNMHVEFDLRNNMLYFAPRDCANNS
ncbi:aspartic proteinase CDR1-like [Nymphaea colorata]|nr:aspartic proteinase CDR1-like [Nymphaea colorata]